MSGWIEIAVEFIKRLMIGQRKGKPPAGSTGRTEPNGTIAAQESALCGDSITVRSESPISVGADVSFGQQEINRRREIVRRFFNDFWMSTEDKPATFAERLARAEGYINERLVACGEAWQLDAQTRQQLGLMSPRARRN